METSQQSINLVSVPKGQELLSGLKSRHFCSVRVVFLNLFPHGDDGRKSHTEKHGEWRIFSCFSAADALTRGCAWSRVTQVFFCHKLS